MEKEDFLKYNYLPVNKRIICQSTRVLFILENNVLKKKEHSNFFLIFYNIDSDLKKLNDKWNIYCRNEVYFTLLFPKDT